MTEEQAIEEWWNAHCERPLWSGRVSHINWSGLSAETREELRMVYRSAQAGTLVTDAADSPGQISTDGTLKGATNVEHDEDCACDLCIGRLGE